MTFFGAPSLLVALGAPYGHDEAFPFLLHVLDGQGDELGAPRSRRDVQAPSICLGYFPAPPHDRSGFRAEQDLMIGFGFARIARCSAFPAPGSATVAGLAARAMSVLHNACRPSGVAVGFIADGAVHVMECDAVEAGALDRAQPLRPLQIAAWRAEALQREREGDALRVELEAPSGAQPLEQRR